MIYSERNHPMQQKRGSIEVICGSMFSGKTEELIRRLKRAKFAKQRVEIFKPKIDTRYSEDEVVSHDRTSIRSTPVESSGSIMLMSGEVDVIGIDEAQFFDEGLVGVCTQLANQGVRVIIAGLDMDFKGKIIPNQSTGFYASDDQISDYESLGTKERRPTLSC
mgnify:CR=1 FL=1